MADQAPPEDVQNSNTGSSAGDEAASAGPKPTFPDRLRVHALAKIIGVTSKQVLAKLGELGIEARSAQSSLGRVDAESVHTAFTAPEESQVADADVPETQAPDAPVAETSSVPAPSAESAPAANAEQASTLFEAPPVESPAAPAPVSRSATPLFLQPEVAAEPPRARRRSRKAAGPAADTGTEAQTTSGSKTAPTGTSDVSTSGVSTSAGDDAAGDTSVEITASASPTEITDAPDRTSRKTDAQDDRDDDSNTDVEEDSTTSDGDDDQSQPRRRRRGRRGRGRGRGDQSNDSNTDDESDDSGDGDSVDNDVDSTNNDVDATDDRSVDADSAGTDAGESDTGESDTDESDTGESDTDGSETEGTDSADEKPTNERRSRRRSRSRGGSKSADQSDDEQSTATDADSDTGDSGAESSADDSDDDDQDGSDGSSRRRRRRRRRRSTGEATSDGTASEDDPPNTVVHEREPRSKSRSKDEVQGITGSTRLEAKRQRRRDGRDAGRRRPPILTESEFLARRESVDRVMVVREKTFPDHGETTQVAVLEDGVLVEHFVTSSASASMVGNVYLGRVQNVLPSMEAAFIDIGRGRNGVLYAGEVNWDAAGLGGNSRKIEQALKPGDQVLVQVSKDPVGHKGARLTTQLSLAGRYLVYVPGGSSTGISRKLPDTERKRLKEILREIVPPEAGVIIRTAAEGVSEEELARDVTRLQAQWATIEEASAKAESGKGSQPQALYEEPDMLVKVIRDLFNEDFVKLVIEGEKSWTTTSNYIETVAADMLPKLERHVSEPGKPDVFEAHRIDEQLAKALDRKVWLPSGGTLVIDRTEAMTVVDVNTGKFTGAGGNLEETVTRNNLEAAEEVVRQMRLRDIGGMIVVDFIDMVLESNRDLVLRRLTEALGRDRTRHQVSEVTSLGLVQMTRKKLGTGLVEAFSTNCEHCQGRGIIVHPYPVESKPDDGSRSGSSRADSSSQRKRRGRDKADQGTGSAPADPNEHVPDPSVKRAHPVALAMAAHHDDVVDDVTPADVVDNAAAADGSHESGPKVIDAAEVAAAQGRQTNGQDSAAAAGGDAVAREVESDSNGSSRRGGRGGRRKASRPAASTVVDEATPAIAATSADPAAAPDGAVADSPVVPEAASEPVVPVGTAGPAETAETVETAEAVQYVEPAEPVVKARRGRRVARKAAAPTAETPDAGTVLVIPATSDGSEPTQAEIEAAPITVPAFAHPEAADVVDEAPVTKPRRRRAAARPAGPPVDA
ncbi:MAG: translation initiation factor IF-2 N-terminal domain-containing protein [Rhodococcus sp. (in: high G+C Gram-positive bacteria)]